MTDTMTDTITNTMTDTIINTKTLLETQPNNNNNINITIKNKKKRKIAIDTVCYQLANNNDIIAIWERFFTHLPNNKDNEYYEIILLKRTPSNGISFNFKPELNLETKFKILQVNDFNYITMNQDIDMLNNICKMNKIDVFISTAFTYCNVIPTIVLINDMTPELNKKTEMVVNNHLPFRSQVIIQREKAIYNASAFITFINKKVSNELLDYYPHILKNNIPCDIIVHTNTNIKNENETKNKLFQYNSIDTYLSHVETTILKPQPFINIILQSYNETNPDRLNEFFYCIHQNLQNPYVKMIYDFGTGIEYTKNNNTKFLDLAKHKYTIVKNNGDKNNGDKNNGDKNNSNETKNTNINCENKWLTFEMAIDYANKQSVNKSLNTGDYWCILNLDIFLDNKSKWNTLRGQINNGFIYAQSRHEFIGCGNTNDDNTNSNSNNNTININKLKENSKMDSNFAKMYHANTQDAWLFKTPLECNDKNIDYNFELGFLGCDNAIAERFMKSGYKVINQPLTYKIFHYDIAKGKTSSNFLEKHKKETKEKLSKMIKPKNKYPERKGSYLVPNYDQMLNANNGQDINLLGLTQNLGGCSNWERYEFISRLFSDRIIINNP